MFEDILKVKKKEKNLEPLTFVHVDKEMPEWMSHFDKDFDAIIHGSYSDIYGNGNDKNDDDNEYSVYMIKDGKIVNHISWYYGWQLTPLENQDIEKAIKMIKEYKERKV